MSFESDIHMALCVLKIFALLVIAYSLWQMSPGRDGYLVKGGHMVGYGNGFPGAVPTAAVNGFGSLDLSASAAGYNVDQSQIGLGAKAGFRNQGYEPPMWNNSGDISMYEGAQAIQAGMGIVSYNDSADAPLTKLPVSGGLVNKGNLTPY